MTKGNPNQTAGSQTQSWKDDPLPALERIGEAARRDSGQRFTSLMHHMTVGLLHEGYYALKRDAAVGVDEMTWREYEDGLADRLCDLHERVQSGRYRAHPSKRIYILKDDGRKRPIGIAVLEDKIVQKAAVYILEQIYEVDFLGFSYGFRPGRSPHNALDAVHVGIKRRHVNWILDLDLESFFDTLDHEWLEKFLEHRIADRRMIRLIKKWLRAGVSEEGEWSATRVGTPQGAVISPLLANIFLHYVFDLWAHQWRGQEARGDVIIVRYADDAVMGFKNADEAERFLDALKERLAKFGLKLNEKKTRLIEFGRFAASNRDRDGEGKPETFDFLGFTHMCGRTRKSGRFEVARKPIAKRISAKLKEIRVELLKRRHDPVAEQGRWLRSVARGYFNYFAVPGTCPSLNDFRTQINRHWLRALRRRSQKGRNLSWARMQRLLDTWIPPVRILHPYPNERLHL